MLSHCIGTKVCHNKSSNVHLKTPHHDPLCKVQNGCQKKTRMKACIHFSQILAKGLFSDRLVNCIILCVFAMINK